MKQLHFLTSVWWFIISTPAHSLLSRHHRSNAMTVTPVATTAGGTASSG